MVTYTVCPYRGRPNLRLEQAKESHLDAQERGCQLAKKWAEGDPSVTASLPLCTLVVEIVDRGEQVTPILHRPPETMESQSLRKLYDYVEFCTPTSKSCVILLRTNHPFRGIFKREKRSCLVSPPPADLVLGFRILPPFVSRRPFVRLPQELLHMIFNEAKLVSENWRKLMLSLALVCRAWSRPALDIMYEDFGNSHDVMCNVFPYAPRLAKTLQHYPALGKKIRRFCTDTFLCNCKVGRENEEYYLGEAIALLTILQAAMNITELRSGGTHQLLTQDFVHTLCSFSNIKELISIGNTKFEPAFVYILNIGDILRFLSHWPLVCRLTLWDIPSAIALDDLPTSTCTITFVSLRLLSLDLSQLRLLTTSWKSALREARISDISGLTNEDIRMWLSEVGPTLEILRIDSRVRNHRSVHEEYAVDAMLPIMKNLVFLDISGNVASHLVLERFAPASNAIPGRRYKLQIHVIPGLTTRRLLKALKTTAWTEIHEPVLLWNRGKMIEKAWKIAARRNICITNVLHM